MRTINFLEWELIVDDELTRTTYAHVDKGNADACGCASCRNFAANRAHVFPGRVKQLFTELGIDYTKDSESAHIYRDENGRHHYSGWFHFKGAFNGRDCNVPLPGGGHTFDLKAISGSFSIGFAHGNALNFFEDPGNLVQVEFSASMPWTLGSEEEPQ